jgi:hypothetical protein
MWNIVSSQNRPFSKHRPSLISMRFGFGALVFFSLMMDFDFLSYEDGLLSEWCEATLSRSGSSLEFWFRLSNADRLELYAFHKRESEIGSLRAWL